VILLSIVPSRETHYQEELKMTDESRVPENKLILRKSARQPMIFHFQPDEFEVVDAANPKRLQEWETMMKERVGLEVKASSFPGVPTVSTCGGVACDCDEVVIVLTVG
jgi:hypothetical protein